MFPARLPIISQPPRGFTNSYSMSFDGTNDYLDAAPFGGSLSTGGTISAWIKSPDTEVVQLVAANITAHGDRLVLGIGGDEVRMNAYDGSSNGQSGGSLSDDTWYHIACTSNQKVYLDGVDVGDGTTIMPSNASLQRFRIGLREDDDNSFNGNIDEVAIWSTVLDADAVAAVYNSGTPFDLTEDKDNYDNASNLVGYWRMEEGTGTSVVNTANSGTSDASLENDATWSSTVPS